MSIRAILVAGVVAGLTLPALSAAAQGRPSVAEQYLFAAANAERAQRSLPPLRWDSALATSAAGHCREMAARENISHQYPGEPELATRGKNAGAHFSMISENVAQATTAVIIHDAWMNSPGHRHNLLDPEVDSIGISVYRRNGELYAVQDFERSVRQMSYDQQEQTVAQLISAAARIGILASSQEARQTCELETGFAGERKPWFVMRFTAGELDHLPDTLVQKLASGKYHQAAVGACPMHGDQAFSSYNVAVMLFP